MADFNNGKKLSTLIFEDVPLETFLGAESARKIGITKIISKITSNKTVAAGIESLLYDELLSEDFERAFKMLLTAKNETQLLKVEATLQIISNKIKTYYQKGSQYLTSKKASLFLYTTQHLIFKLGKWKLPNKQCNIYEPQLAKKLKYARFKCKCLNIKDDTIRLECFTDAYQQPYDKNLRNFEFLDEQKLNSFIKRVERYETTFNIDDLYEKKPLNELYVSVKNANNIENLIAYIKAYKGIKDLTLHYYTRNFHAINDIIAQYVGSNDLYNIYNIAEALKDFLQREEHFKAIINYENTRIK